MNLLGSMVGSAIPAKLAIDGPVLDAPLLGVGALADVPFEIPVTSVAQVVTCPASG